MIPDAKDHLFALEPHRRGRIPVVLVHGTASSPFRWADMVNDLLEDKEIRDHYEFWFFTYNTGNPIPLSADVLRHSLEDAVKSLGRRAGRPGTRPDGGDRPQPGRTADQDDRPSSPARRSGTRSATGRWTN